MSKFLSNPIIALLLLVLLAAISILVLNLAARPTMDAYDWQESTYVVQSGDSLWAISRQYCPDGVDCREWIDEVQALNRINGGIIHPGQCLTVLEPVEED